MLKHDRKLDLAARAAWLYYVAGKRQDEIAGQLNVSRQAVQRLVSLAVSEKLIKFRLDHPIAECMALSEELKARYGLAYCSVQPTDSTGEHPSAGIAIAAAEHLTTYLAERAPLIVAFSTGRMLRAMADEMPAMDCPQHKLVSLVGTISRDGQASSYEVVRRFAERTGAQCFPIPTPVVASSVEERRLLQTQRSFAVVRELASRAVVAFVGVGNIGWQSPMHRDHFVTDQEITELIEHGAVGEIAGWAYDSCGPRGRQLGQRAQRGLAADRARAYAHDRRQRQPGPGDRDQRRPARRAARRPDHRRTDRPGAAARPNQP